MRLVSIVVTLIFLAGCSFSPPKPQECQGEFRPINIEQNSVIAVSHKDNLALCMDGGSYVRG